MLLSINTQYFNLKFWGESQAGGGGGIPGRPPPPLYETLHDTHTQASSSSDQLSTHFELPTRPTHSSHATLDRFLLLTRGKHVFSTSQEQLILVCQECLDCLHVPQTSSLPTAVAIVTIVPLLAIVCLCR